MPSPVGHSLVGLAVAIAIGIPRAPWQQWGNILYRHRGFLFVALILANLPDVDYVPGFFVGDWHAYHHGYTHTLGWVVLVSLAVWLVAWHKAPGKGFGVFLASCALAGSHLLADLVTDDGRFPYGIMLLWPLTERHFISPVSVFWRLEKATLDDVFQWYNVRAVAVEFIRALPLVLAALVYKHFSSKQPAGRT
jgi:membrane-bound metal-dependent hydrolase YbcI (DUF457 family)